MDTGFLISIGVLVLLSASTCFAALKLNICNSDLTRRYLLMFIAASLSMLALQFTSDFPISGTPVLQMPGAIIVFLPLFAVATWFVNRHPQQNNFIITGILALLLLGAAHYLSFPWDNRGTEGWIALSIMLAASVCYISHMQSQGGDRSTQSILWWAAHSISCIPLLLNLKAVGHIEILLLVLTPIAIIGFTSWALGQAVFQLRLAAFIGITVTLFLGNAVIRYVPAYDDPAFITNISMYSPLLLLLSATLLAFSHTGQRSRKIISQCLAALCLIIAITASIFAYTYEAEVEETSANEWDYNSFY